MANPDNEFYRRLLEGVELEGLDTLPKPPSEENAEPRSSFSGWQERPNVIQPDDGEKLTLESGLVAIEVSTNKGFVKFSWDGLHEIFKKPIGEESDKAEERILKGIFPLMFQQMPGLLGLAKRTEALTIEEYRRTNRAVIKYKGEPEDANYTFNTESDRLKFGVNYAARSAEIESLRIYGGSSNYSADFIVGVSYGERSARDQMVFCLPSDQRGIRACTPELAEWMLGSHMRSAELGNLTVPSAYLFDSMHGILRRTAERFKK